MIRHRTWRLNIRRTLRYRKTAQRLEPIEINSPRRTSSEEEVNMANPNQQFRSALGRCGFNATSRTYLQTMGLDLETLLDYTEDEFSQLTSGARYYHIPAGAAQPLILQPSALKKLKGMQQWMIYCELRHQDYDATDYTNNQVEKWSKRVTFLRREKDKDKGEPTKPDPLKSIKKYSTFEQQLLTYLGQLRGTTGTRLTYLMRDHEEPTQEMFDEDYEDIDDDLYDNIHFDHELAKEDDEQFYNLLKELCSDGQAETYVNNYEKQRSGRKAIMQIKAICEGDAGRTTKTAEANKVRRSQFYYGPKRTYNLELHISKLHEAYRTLAKYGQPVAEETQVQEFLDSIKDRRLTQNKLNILENSERRKSFTLAAESMKTAALVMETSSDRRSTLPGREVLQVHTGKPGSGFPGPITARNYTSEEIKLFTADQKEELKRVRRKAREKRSYKSKRQAASLETADSDSDDGGDNDEGERTASDQFGRHARKGAKAKKSKKQS